MSLSIKSRITLNDGYQWSQVKPKAEETLEAYFLEMRKNWEKGNLVVRISQIENRLLNLDGILDVADTQLNDVASNLALRVDFISALHLRQDLQLLEPFTIITVSYRIRSISQRLRAVFMIQMLKSILQRMSR